IHPVRRTAPCPSSLVAGLIHTQPQRHACGKPGSNYPSWARRTPTRASQAPCYVPFRLIGWQPRAQCRVQGRKCTNQLTSGPTPSIVVQARSAWFVGRLHEDKRSADYPQTLSLLRCGIDRVLRGVALGTLYDQKRGDKIVCGECLRVILVR